MLEIGEKRPIERLPLTVIFQEVSDAKETYGGGFNTVLLEGQFLKPKDSECDTVLIFMHPTGLMNWLPMPIALAQMGLPVMCCGSRYPHNDSTLIMEKVVVDLGRYIRHAKEELGFKKVVLAGWSGGGSLSMFYQAEAEAPSLTSTPAGDLPDLTKANLEPADAVLQLAAHVSRAITLSEWIDASILDETDPSKKDPELDLYDPKNPNQPPYSEAFLTRYREAQAGRIRKITAWVKAEIARLKSESDEYQERAFVVHGTMADPRWLDPAVDPNDRKPGWSYMGDPRLVNNLPAGLARYCSLRSWLSQWSEESNADGPACAARIKVPFLVIENSADDACTPSHAARIYGAITHDDKEIHCIKGATHYYFGQKDKLAEAANVIFDWLKKKNFA
jgi:pimeloyl-ACP methyl ester carboxylesterase